MVEGNVLMMFRLLSRVETIRVSIGYVVGGAKSPLTPMETTLLASRVAERKVETVTNLVEYNPSQLIVLLLISGVMP